MAASISDAPIRRWAESWQAHIQFCLANFTTAKEIAARLVLESATTEHSCLARTSATIASVLHYFCRLDLARPWYEFARWHATNEGDDLTIDVILHNTAAYDLNALRLAEIESNIDDREVERVALELSSSINYDRIKSPSSFRWMLPLLDIHLTLLRGEFAAATDQIEDWLREYSRIAPGRLVSISLSDLSLSLARSGRHSDASERLQSAIDSLPADATTDDRAILFFRCAEVARSAARTDKAAEFEQLANRHLGEFRSQQAQCVPMFAEIVRPALKKG